MILKKRRARIEKCTRLIGSIFSIPPKGKFNHRKNIVTLLAKRHMNYSARRPICIKPDSIMCDGANRDE